MKLNRIILTVMVFSALAMGLVVAMLQPVNNHPQSKHPPLVLDNPSKPRDSLRVYFVKDKANTTTTEGVARPLKAPVSGKVALVESMTQLLKGPTAQEKKQGYVSEIPAETKLMDIKEDPKNHELRVNLSEDFITGGGSNSMTQRLDQVRKTIISSGQSVPVYLDVNGKQLDVLGSEGVEVQEPINANASAGQ